MFVPYVCQHLFGGRTCRTHLIALASCLIVISCTTLSTRAQADGMATDVSSFYTTYVSVMKMDTNDYFARARSTSWTLTKYSSDAVRIQYENESESGSCHSTLIERFGDYRTMFHCSDGIFDDRMIVIQQWSNGDLRVSIGSESEPQGLEFEGNIAYRRSDVFTNWPVDNNLNAIMAAMLRK